MRSRALARPSPGGPRRPGGDVYHRGCAYSLLYERAHQRFQLRSTTLKEGGEPGDWRGLSLWLFDEREGTRADAESILNDFLEVVQGPKRVALVQQKHRSKKDGDRVVDPLFFYEPAGEHFPRAEG